MHSFLKNTLAASSLLASSLALANISVPVYFVTEPNLGKMAGTIEVSETKYGLLFTPDLQGFKPGTHGFHIHQNPSCEQNGMAAGGHLDPNDTNKHLGPYNEKGHLGDLPAIYINADGSSTLPLLAPRFMHLDEIRNHSLMLHEGGDNYSDAPEKLGGGGTRMICGVIK
ncbi:MAG TPA: superoxide dismutase family protein [Gammaproteobacteria bacterium]|nr:superoxide dismutase family protein [Gammaproteobacteria bacterium]